jgi:hypothetical protein
MAELLLEQGSYVVGGIIPRARERRVVVNREASWFQCYDGYHVNQCATSATDSSSATPPQVPF